MIRTPSAAKTSSKARVNLASRSRRRNRGTMAPSRDSISIERSRARWMTQAPFGWSVTPATRTCRVCSSMKNKTVEGLEADGLHGEEVGGDDAGGLRSKERSPGDRRPSGRGSQPVAQQDGADGSRRHADAELLELALDALVAPARVLSGQPQDQRHHMVGEWRTTAPMVGLGPFAGDQPAVPPQDRVRRHQEDRPALAGKRSAQRREECTIGGLELGPLDLAAQHLELVAENGELDVFGVLAVEASQQHADKPACHEVKEGQGHRLIVPDPDSRCSALAAEVSEPHAPNPGKGSCPSAPRNRDYFLWAPSGRAGVIEMEQCLPASTNRSLRVR